MQPCKFHPTDFFELSLIEVSPAAGSFDELQRLCLDLSDRLKPPAATPKIDPPAFHEPTMVAIVAMFAALTFAQLVGVTVASLVVGLVALLMALKSLCRPGRKGEHVELRYGWFERPYDIDDTDHPF